MSRKPAQINIETYERLEQYKNKKGAYSLSNAIDRLLDYQEKEIKHIELSDKTLELLNEIKNDIRVKDTDKAIFILLEHWLLSGEVSKPILMNILEAQNSYRYY